MTDPGWGEPIRLALTYRHARASNVLIALRALVVTMTTAMVLIPAVAALLVSTADLPGEVDVVVMLVVVSTVGGAAAVGAGKIKPPLSCESDGALTGGFRTRVLLGVLLEPITR